MKIKIFTTAEEDQINDFIGKVKVSEQNGIQITSDHEVVIFYEETQEEYKPKYLKRLLENLQKEVFHEEIRLISLKADLEKAIEQQGDYSDKSPEGKVRKEKEKSIKTSEENIELFRTKIDLYTKELSKLNGE